MGLNGKLFRRRLLLGPDNSFSLFAINTRLVSGSRMLLETVSLRHLAGRNFRSLIVELTAIFFILEPTDDRQGFRRGDEISIKL
jgi:hypothetical protein